MESSFPWMFQQVFVLEGTMANEITRANAGGPRRSAIRTRLAARIAQFWRSGEAL
jgi:hypothetical protein